jgi:hypothetical protein
MTARIFRLMLVMAFLSQALLEADEDSAFDKVFMKIAAKLSEAKERLPNKTVAIYGFEVIGRPGDSYAVYATEKLTHYMVTLGTYSVIERSRIEEIMKEQNLSLSGAIDANTASKIGKILAVDAVITGTIHVTDTETEFIARIIQSEKGLILGSSDERVRVGIAKGEESVTEKDAATVTADTSERIHAAASNPKISTDRTTYSSDDPITVSYSGLPGNKNDWITLVLASRPDTTYGKWVYTEGKKSGMHTFTPVSPGVYEARLYFDWPQGGYVVHGRVKITVN